MGLLNDAVKEPDSFLLSSPSTDELHYKAGSSSGEHSGCQQLLATCLLTHIQGGGHQSSQKSKEASFRSCPFLLVQIDHLSIPEPLI